MQCPRVEAIMISYNDRLYVHSNLPNDPLEENIFSDLQIRTYNMDISRHSLIPVHYIAF